MTTIALLTGFSDDTGRFDCDKSFVCERENVLLNGVCAHANGLPNGFVTGITLVRCAVFTVEQVRVDGDLSGR